MISERRNTCLRDAPRARARRRTICTLAVLLFVPVSVPSLRAQENAARAAPAPPKRLSLAFLGLENQTGDAELDHCRYATMLLSGSFREVKTVRVLSGEAVRYALRQVGLQPGDPIDPNRARRMGELIEAQRVIWGRYSKKADLWQVRMRVMNVATGAVLPDFSGEASDWFDLRDKLNDEIPAALSITLSAEEKKKATERWTRSAEALDWLFRIQWSQDQGKPVTDLETLSRKAIAADPNCAMAYGNLAVTLATQGKFDPAEEAAAKALQLKPDFAQARAILGWMYLTQQRFDRAEVELRRACQRDGNDVESLTLLAVACGQNGKRDEALGLLEKAVSLDRTDASAHAHLASAYAARKRQDDALRELEEARRYLPEGILAANALLMIGDAYQSLGRYPEAIESYERAMATVKGLGVSLQTLQYVEQRIQGVKSFLAPTFIQASVPQRYTENELDRILWDKLTDDEHVLIGNPFSCTDAMSQWAKELAQGAGTDLDKARAIFRELSARLDGPGRLKSRTAQAVFDAWKNAGIRLVCMDQAVLFVALARAADLDAFFVHVTRLPDGKAVNHACATVFLGNRAVLVDPAQHWLGVPHRQYAVLDDLQATAFLCFNNRRDGDPAKLAAYRAGLKLWPDSWQGRVFLAGALWRAGQAPEAQRVFAEIPPPQSEDWEAAIYWGVAAEAEAAGQNWERAQEHLLKSLAIDPEQSEAHFNVGMIYARHHRLAEARTEFRTCLRYEPSERTAEVARGAIARINEEIGVEATPETAPPDSKPQ